MTKDGSIGIIAAEHELPYDRPHRQEAMERAQDIRSDLS